MKKQPEITEQTRKNIITAFCQIYANKPMEQIHVKEVIAKAGYNRSTFYEYFSDIYAVRTAMEEEVIQYIKSGIQNHHPTETDLLRLLLEKEEYLKVLLGTHGSVHFQDRLKKELLSEKASLDASDKLQAYLNEFHLSVSLSMYRLWLQKKDLSLDELSILIHTLYMNGISGISTENDTQL